MLAKRASISCGGQEIVAFLGGYGAESLGLQGFELLLVLIHPLQLRLNLCNQPILRGRLLLMPVLPGLLAMRTMRARCVIGGGLLGLGGLVQEVVEGICGVVVLVVTACLLLVDPGVQEQGTDVPQVALLVILAHHLGLLNGFGLSYLG